MKRVGVGSLAIAGGGVASVGAAFGADLGCAQCVAASWALVGAVDGPQDPSPSEDDHDSADRTDGEEAHEHWSPTFPVVLEGTQDGKEQEAGEP